MRYIAVLLILLAVPVFAGEKEEITLQIQVVREHIARLNDVLYFIPFEKKVYEDALKDLQGKQAELSKTPTKNKD
jgi:hypothetical protein